MGPCPIATGEGITLFLADVSSTWWSMEQGEQDEQCFSDAASCQTG